MATQNTLAGRWIGGAQTITEERRSVLIKSDDRNAIKAYWALAVVWNLIAAPLLFLIPGQLAQGNRTAALGLLFPLVGAFIVAAAIRATLRRRKFGNSRLQMETLPAPIGRRLKARLLVDKGLDSEKLTATLNCTRTTWVRRGSKRRKKEELLFQERVDMPMVRGASSIPLEVDIPADCRPSDPDKKIAWSLNVLAATSGLDYASHFKVPVFADPNSPPATARPDGPATGAPTAIPESVFADAHIRITRNEPDLLHIEVPSVLKRNPGLTLKLLAFFVVWTGLVVFMFKAPSAPTVFAAVFGLFDVIIGWALIKYCLQSIRIEVSRQGLDWVSSWGPIRTRRRFARHTVERVDFKKSGSSGDGASKTLRYALCLHRGGSDGRPVQLGADFTDKRLVRWMAARINVVLGVGDGPAGLEYR